MPAPFIDDVAQLRSLCERLRDAPWIALDTEFMRVSTYRARLCLIQLATPDVIACVDPLALADLTPLLDLLYLPSVVKVLHAARQDLEVLADIRGAPPRPIFDTQIAASLLGYDDQIGYSALVEKITGHKLDKVEARTDWAARPLSAAQHRYAEDDVRYLRDVYVQTRTRLQQLGREDWLVQECAALTDPMLYRNDPSDAWRRLGGGASLSTPQQSVLAALAVWREREAQNRDTPRGWVVPDTALVELARRQPDSEAALSQIADLKPTVVRRDGGALLRVIQDARAQPAKQYWDAVDRLSPAQSALIKHLSTIVQERASAANISPTLIAPRRELVRLVRGDTGGTLLQGWRRQFVGEELLERLRTT
jgi:ribonuclease D